MEQLPNVLEPSTAIVAPLVAMLVIVVRFVRSDRAYHDAADYLREELNVLQADVTNMKATHRAEVEELKAANRTLHEEHVTCQRRIAELEHAMIRAGIDP